MSGPKCVGLRANDREQLRQQNALTADQLLARYRRKEYELQATSKKIQSLGKSFSVHDIKSYAELRRVTDEAIKSWLDCDALEALQVQLSKISSALDEATNILKQTAESHIRSENSHKDAQENLLLVSKEIRQAFTENIENSDQLATFSLKSLPSQCNQ